MKDKRIAAVAVAVGMAISLTAQAECTTLDFENMDTGTPVFGLYTISPLLSIYGYEAMEVIEEDLSSNNPGNPSILAYNSNVYGSNADGGQNWLPGSNAKSFGNASTVRGVTSQDLVIVFNPDIDVASFAIDISDFGDWFPIGGSNPRIVTLKAFDEFDVELYETGLSLDGPTPNHDVYNAGLRNMAGTVNNAAIASVTLEFEDLDPGVSFDNIEVCEIQQASIEVSDVVLNYPETISYCISNEAGGTTTWVTLGDVTVRLGKKVKGVFTDICPLFVPADGSGVTLDPGQQLCFEAIACQPFDSKMKAIVEVDGATNQLGVPREKVWHDTSE